MGAPRIALTALVTAGLTALGAVAAAPAQAATYTTNGVRCTKVGTSGDDVIRGTSSRDVICGLGGNDTIYGDGGDDVIDAGAGNDLVLGGSGNDVVLAGAGSDRVGCGDGNDQLWGADGDDLITGGNGTDKIWGGYGKDRLDGGPSADGMDGGPGDDSMVGGDGNDVEYGGIGDDIMTGGSGSDAIYGTDGNDDLDGGYGADQMVGGAGTNWCTMDSSDTTRRQCVYDAKLPWAGTLRLSVPSVDVTYAPRTVDYAVWVGDDTGVTSVQVQGQSADGRVSLAYPGPARRTWGTPRGGWWTGTLRVARYIEPATLTIYANLTDRVGRRTYRAYRDALTVADRLPDRAMPRVNYMAISPTSVNVLSAPATVKATVRLTDDLSGVRDAVLCPSHAQDNGPGQPTFGQVGGCDTMTLVSGTTRDGWWTGSYTVPKGGFGGDWNFSVWTTDEAHPSATGYWFGPDEWASVQAMPGGSTEPAYHQIPGGAGRFTVVGVGDTHAPVLRTVTISPASVDTLPAAATVSVDVAATDVEGVRDVSLVVHSPETATGGGLTPYSDTVLAPTRGTRQNGVWHFSVVLPQGTPPGTYVLQVLVTDSSHFRTWVSAASPYAGYPGQSVLTAAQTPGTDGTIKVVPHSG